MRIALAHSHPNTLGGGERAVLEVARGLAARHEVRLLVGDFRPEATYPGLAALPLRRLATVEWFAAPIRPDEVAVTNSFGANLLALRQGRRVLCWVHSLRSPFLKPGRLRPELLARRALDWLAVRRAAIVVANSSYTASRLPALYGRAADAVVYPGVEVAGQTPDRQPQGYAITVGRLSPEKGLDRLFNAWHSLPGVPLKVVGTGDPAFAASLKQLAPEGVELVGSLSGNALRAALAGASVAVFAPYDEELGLAPLEAMAAGVPVVSWRSGGIAETMVDGTTGFLVDGEHALAERVQHILRNPGLGAALGEAGRDRAQAFSWTKTIAEIESLCQALAERLKREPGRPR